MPSSQATTQVAPRSAQEIYEVIARKVRADSMDENRLTHVEELGPLFPEMTPEEIVNYLGELYDIEDFNDVRATVSPSGAALLYSTSCFSAADAAERCLADEACDTIADRVRKDSEMTARLTPVAGLSELFPDLASEKLVQYVEQTPSRKEHADICSLTGPTGLRYLFSDRHMTEQYATLLARADAQDPTVMIAETVREESRIYPRPTKVTLFYEPVFRIEPAQMKDMVERTLARPDCADIKMIVAPTGAVYLYSDRYMPAAQAEQWIQWEEVERFQNP